MPDDLPAFGTRAALHDDLPHRNRDRRHGGGSRRDEQGGISAQRLGRAHPLEVCPDCKVALPPQPGPAHPYFGASPSCWEMYGDVLAREYASPELMRIHRLTVDAYAVQHPGAPQRRSIQSVWVHLAGLYLTIERDLSHDFARRVIGSLTGEAGRLTWLPAPDDLGIITVADVACTVGADAHRDAVQRWARTAWAAWKVHHEAVASIADKAAARL